MNHGFDDLREHLLGIFLEEAAEHREVLERGALALEAGHVHGELVGEIFRAAHSIKGAAASLGFKEITALTHVLEDLLDALREGRLNASRSLGATLLGAVDALGRLIEAVRTNTPAPDVSDTVAALTAARQEQACASETSSQPAASHLLPLLRAPAPRLAPAEPENTEAERLGFHISFVPDPEAFARGLDPVLLLRDLSALCERYSCTTLTDDVPIASALDPERSRCGFAIDIETRRSRSDIEEIFEFAGGTLLIEARPAGRADEATLPQAATPAALSSPAQVEGPSPALAHASASSVRVDVRKIDRLMDVVGEIVISQAMLKDLVAHLTPERMPALLATVQVMERNTRELQERMMGVRMLPVSTLFQRFPRLVRELGEKLDKRVQLVIEGGDTELDKGLIELLGDPLTHLVRNAVDHGVESPEERRAAGKPEIGTITLRAEHEAGAVVLTVGDDGRGIDVPRVVAKARRNGLVSPDEEVDDEKAFSLLFEPGFSTAEAVTDVSGRGVGMDVVQKNIAALNGFVNVKNAPGKGAAFVVRLPLTLAIIDGLSVAVGRQTFVLPLLAMIQAFRARPEQLRRMPDGREMVMVQKRPLPLLRLSRLLEVPGAVTRAEDGLTIVVQEAGHMYALLVDGMRGRMQVVMKNLEANYGRIEGILGATILGDGRVGLVLDVAGLARRQRGDSATEPTSATAPPSASAVSERRFPS